MSARAIRLRALQPADLATAPLDVRRLGDLLQLLVAHGDLEWVASIHDSVKARVAWVIERDGDAAPRKRR